MDAVDIGKKQYSKQLLEWKEVCKCLNFIETQVVFLDSQWKKRGIELITPDFYKKIKETVECTRISPARIIQWINDYSKANNFVSCEGRVKKIKLCLLVSILL